MPSTHKPSRRLTGLKSSRATALAIDNVDLDAARGKGIVVTNTPGANSVSVAELALGLMLALARQIPEAVEAVHQGKWPRYSGISLEGKTIGILGLGAIGKQLARRLAGFDCKILAYDPYADAAFARDNHIELTLMDKVIEEADFISLHLPLLPETRGLVNAAFLNRMKKGSFLVNTSRGEVVDETALLNALQSGHSKEPGLDAFTVEPPGCRESSAGFTAGDCHTPSGCANRWSHQQYGLVCHARLPGSIER